MAEVKHVSEDLTGLADKTIEQATETMNLTLTTTEA